MKNEQTNAAQMIQAIHLAKGDRVLVGSKRELKMVSDVWCPSTGRVQIRWWDEATTTAAKLDFEFEVVKAADVSALERADEGEERLHAAFDAERQAEYDCDC